MVACVAASDLLCDCLMRPNLVAVCNLSHHRSCIPLHASCLQPTNLPESGPDGRGRCTNEPFQPLPHAVGAVNLSTQAVRGGGAVHGAASGGRGHAGGTKPRTHTHLPRIAALHTCCHLRAFASKFANSWHMLYSCCFKICEQLAHVIYILQN
jgi:hypothetical protein